MRIPLGCESTVGNALCLRGDRVGVKHKALRFRVELLPFSHMPLKWRSLPLMRHVGWALLGLFSLKGNSNE